MKVAVFASTDTGLKVVQLFRSIGHKLEYLVLNDEEDPDMREAIVAAADANRVIPYKQLLRSISLDDPLVQAGSIDIGILAWWPHIIGNRIRSLSSRGFLNFHPSMLPFNRGKNPNFWALANDTPHGVSIHWVDDNIDGGPIAFRRPIEITWTDTGESLYAKSKEAIFELFRDSLPSILAADIPRIPQAQDFGVHYSKQLDPASRIELDHEYRARDLLNLLRARTFKPYPGCRFTERGRTYEVRISIEEVDSAGGAF